MVAVLKAFGVQKCCCGYFYIVRNYEKMKAAERDEICREHLAKRKEYEAEQLLRKKLKSNSVAHNHLQLKAKKHSISKASKETGVPKSVYQEKLILVYYVNNFKPIENKHALVYRLCLLIACQLEFCNSDEDRNRRCVRMLKSSTWCSVHSHCNKRFMLRYIKVQIQLICMMQANVDFRSTVNSPIPDKHTQLHAYHAREAREYLCHLEIDFLMRQSTVKLWLKVN